MRRDARLSAMQLHCSNGLMVVSAFIDCPYGYWRLDATAKASHRLHEKNNLGMRAYASTLLDATNRDGAARRRESRQESCVCPGHIQGSLRMDGADNCSRAAEQGPRANRRSLAKLWGVAGIVVAALGIGWL